MSPLLQDLRQQGAHQFIRVAISDGAGGTPGAGRFFCVALANHYLLAVAPCRAVESNAFMVFTIAGGPRHVPPFEQKFGFGTARTDSLSAEEVLELIGRYARATTGFTTQAMARAC